MTTRPDPIATVTSGTLAAIGALHVVWGRRAGRPPTERGRRMSEAVSGAGRPPSPAACYAVAGLLATAAALVAGQPARGPRLRLAGQTGVAAVLGARGLLGVVGRTDLVAPGQVTPQMRRWDRRLYTPLALALAAGAAHSARRTARTLR
ncbi:MAG TPA: DUF3995 domain-containing protein [Iamia sp.]|nr:DUF3995 domain-containing protein [Iamia sp.]